MRLVNRCCALGLMALTLLLGGCFTGGTVIWDSRQVPHFLYSDFKYAVHTDGLLVQAIPDSAFHSGSSASIVEAIQTLPQFYRLRDRLETDAKTETRNRLIFLFHPDPDVSGHMVCEGNASSTAPNGKTELLLVLCLGERRVSELRASHPRLTDLASDEARDFLRSVLTNLVPIHQPRRFNSNI